MKKIVVWGLVAVTSLSSIPVPNFAQEGSVDIPVLEATQENTSVLENVVNLNLKQPLVIQEVGAFRSKVSWRFEEVQDPNILNYGMEYGSSNTFENPSTFTRERENRVKGWNAYINHDSEITYVRSFVDFVDGHREYGDVLTLKRSEKIPTLKFISKEVNVSGAVIEAAIENYTWEGDFSSATVNADYVQPILKDEKMYIFVEGLKPNATNQVSIGIDNSTGANFTVDLETKEDKVVTAEDLDHNEALYGFLKEKFETDTLCESQLDAVRQLDLTKTSNMSFKGFDKLKYLKEINAANCGLESLEGLQTVKYLNILKVNQNQLTALPNFTQSHFLGVGAHVNFSNNMLAPFYFTDAYLPKAVLDRTIWIEEQKYSQGEYPNENQKKHLIYAPVTFYGIGSKMPVFFIFNDFNRFPEYTYQLRLNGNIVPITLQKYGVFGNQDIPTEWIQSEKNTLEMTILEGDKVVQTQTQEVFFEAGKDFKIQDNQKRMGLHQSRYFFSIQNYSEPLNQIEEVRLLDAQGNVVMFSDKDRFSVDSRDYYESRYNTHLALDIKVQNILGSMIQVSAMPEGTYRFVIKDGEKGLVDTGETLEVTSKPFVSQFLYNYDYKALVKENIIAVTVEGYGLDYKSLKPMVTNKKGDSVGTVVGRKFMGLSTVYFMQLPENDSRETNQISFMDKSISYTLDRFNDVDFEYLEYYPEDSYVYIKTFGVEDGTYDVELTSSDYKNPKTLAETQITIKNGEAKSNFNNFAFDSNQSYLVRIKIKDFEISKSFYIHKDNLLEESKITKCFFEVGQSKLESSFKCDADIKSLEGVTALLYKDDALTSANVVLKKGQEPNTLNVSVGGKSLTEGSYKLMIQAGGKSIHQLNIHAFKKDKLYFEGYFGLFDDTHGLLDFSYYGSAFDAKNLSVTLKDALGRTVPVENMTFERHPIATKRATITIKGDFTNYSQLIGTYLYNGQPIDSFFSPGTVDTESFYMYKGFNKNAKEAFLYEVQKGMSRITGVETEGKAILYIYDMFGYTPLKTFDVNKEKSFTAEDLKGLEQNIKYALVLEDLNGKCLETTTAYLYESHVEIPVTGIKILNKELSVFVGDRVMISYEVLPATAVNKAVSYSIEDPSILALVNGQLIGKKAGKTKVTVTTNDGKFSEVCEVTVKAKPVTPGPVTPGPVTPGPVTPGPVTPGPVTPGPVKPGPVTPKPDPKTPEKDWGEKGSLTKGDFEKSFAGSEGTVSIKSGNVSLTVAKAQAEKVLEKAPIDFSMSYEEKTGVYKFATTNTVRGWLKLPLGEMSSSAVAMKVEADGSMKPYPMSKTSDGSLYIFVKDDMRFTLQEPKKMNFKDTAGHWAQSAIDFVTARDIMVGTEKGSFSPNTPMTRGMFVTMLYKMSGAPEATGEGFADVSERAYYAKASKWALENGLISGVKNKANETQFEGNAVLTREAMFTILKAYLEDQGLLEVMSNKASGKGLKAYTDAHMVSDWSQEALTSLIDAGLLTGDSKRALNPKGHATRGEAATLIFRLNP